MTGFMFVFMLLCTRERMCFFAIIAVVVVVVSVAVVLLFIVSCSIHQKESTE